MDLFETQNNTDKTPQRQVLSVSQLNLQARQLLERQFPMIWVEGELSNFVRPASGHWYFSLKDQKAQVRCAMFKNRSQYTRFKPENGNQVLVRCRVSLYEGRGDFQLIAEHMEEAGDGALRRAFEELKQQLAKEGLFDDGYKQPLPDLPEHIGVITSATGAAVRDILTVLERRFPAIPVTVIPVLVQGNEAAAQIANAIQLANRVKLCDALIVGRGGGSLEDLWPFNEEVVARAIFDSEIPIVSAVGHEIDFTIADFVADVRAATPSAAAELLSPDQDEWLQTFQGFEHLLKNEMQTLINNNKQKVNWLSKRLRHPGQQLQEQSQKLDSLDIRLQHAIQHQLKHSKAELKQLSSELWRHTPKHQIQQLALEQKALSQRLSSGMRFKLEESKHRLVNAANTMDALSPLATLTRGYAIVRDQQGNLIRNHQQTKAGDKISAQLGKGQLLCTVDEVSNKTPVQKKVS